MQSIVSPVVDRRYSFFNGLLNLSDESPKQLIEVQRESIAMKPDCLMDSRRLSF